LLNTKNYYFKFKKIIKNNTKYFLILILLFFTFIKVDLQKRSTFLFFEEKILNILSNNSTITTIEKTFPNVGNLELLDSINSEEDFKDYLRNEPFLRKGKNVTYEQLNLSYFSFCCDELSRSQMGNKPFGYIEFYKNNLILVTGYGEIISINSNDFTSKKLFEFELVESNIKELINNNNIFEIDIEGIRGIEIHEDLLYVSYMENLNNCYKINLLRGNLTQNKILFEKYFDQSQCLNPKVDKPFTYGAGGGKIEIVDDDVYLTVGDFKVYTEAQDDNSVFGKIIKILSPTEYEIVSKGHRNPQGLTITKDRKNLISTEHGPQGGDEINLLNFDRVNNFGWPKASYGVHYDNSYYEIYAEQAPLLNPHSEFGYEEPLYWVDFSPFGISDIITNNFNNLNSYIVGSLNGGKLYFLEFNKNYTSIKKINQININNRIRDISYSEELDKYALILEEPPEIIIMDKKK
jgi:hypothetical protein